MDETAKRDIKGILLSVGKPCTLRELSKLYSEQIGQQIDFRKYGFASLERCLLGNPDVSITMIFNKNFYLLSLVIHSQICKLHYSGGECYVDRVLTENTKHLDLMTKAIHRRKNVVQRTRLYHFLNRFFVHIKN